MSDLPHTCSCGRRVEPGAVCPCKAGRCLACGIPISYGSHCPACAAKLREVRQPGRRHYRTAEYKRNRIERYHLVGGRCEACGIDLVGDLHDEGAPWESDHMIAIVDGGDDSVANLRVYCLPHHKLKTKMDRARRAGERRRSSR